MYKIKIVYIGGITDEYECEYHEYNYNGNVIIIDCYDKRVVIPLFSVRYIEIIREDGVCLSK